MGSAASSPMFADESLKGSDEPCPICLESLSSAPAFKLDCSHAMHIMCAEEQLSAIKWKGKEIKVAELNCPAGCGAILSNARFARQITPLRAVADRAKAAAAKQAEADGVTDEPLAKYRVFQCNDCAEPFVGGLRRCGALEDPEAKALCDGCRAKTTGICKKHGEEFTAYKCNYCCQAATFTCGGGNERFCTACHIGAAKMFHEGKWANWQREAIRHIPACDPATCPFGGAHPKGRTHSWHAPCAKCFPARDAIAPPPAAKDAIVARKKCETPGCNYAAAREAAGWNANGRHCCAGCMSHGSYATMGPNPAPPPHACHEGRCAREAFRCRPCA